MASAATTTRGGRLLAAVTVRDAPRYPWRGLSVDVARHPLPPTDLLRLLDLVADLRMNRLHLHLTDDQGWRLHLPSRPELTARSGGTAVDGDFGNGTAAAVAAYRRVHGLAPGTTVADDGRWTLPGGGLDFGEDPRDGALRELAEETGYIGELDELLSEADFVCLVVPLSAATEGLIGARELGLMKSSAILINLARGPVIDEAALIEALRSGQIRGAGLDVYTREPLEASPLFELPNVVTLPHIGSATHETRYAMAERAVDNLIAALEGKQPTDLVNPAALDRR